MLHSNHIATISAPVPYNFSRLMREKRMAFYLDEAARHDALDDRLPGDIKYASNQNS